MTCLEYSHETGYHPLTTQYNLPHPEYDPLLPGHTLVQPSDTETPTLLPWSLALYFLSTLDPQVHPLNYWVPGYGKHGTSLASGPPGATSVAV